ncbi:MAG: hypothetical protein NC299_11250 [Lachnospiraceae bacterium]|nr:hypothetical protein [Lachnospiraceae bacterium]
MQVFNWEIAKKYTNAQIVDNMCIILQLFAVEMQSFAAVLQLFAHICSFAL